MASRVGNNNILGSVGQDYALVPMRGSPELGHSSSVVFADARKQLPPPED